MRFKPVLYSHLFNLQTRSNELLRDSITQGIACYETRLHRLIPRYHYLSEVAVFNCCGRNVLVYNILQVHLQRSSLCYLEGFALWPDSQRVSLKSFGAHPIKDELDSFRVTFKSTYPDASARLSSFEHPTISMALLMMNLFAP